MIFRIKRQKRCTDNYKNVARWKHKKCAITSILKVKREKESYENMKVIYITNT
jgi:hypothetical protein